MGGGMPDLGGGIGGSPSSPDLGQQGLEGQAPEQSPQDELLKENFNKKLKEYTYNGSDIMNEMIKKIENIDKAIN